VHAVVAAFIHAGFLSLSLSLVGGGAMAAFLFSGRCPDLLPEHQRFGVD